MKYRSTMKRSLNVVCQLSIVMCQLSISSCTELNLRHSGMLHIRPVPALPHGVEYRFYGTEATLARSDDGVGNFRGKLPADTYRVLAVNAGAEGVAFSGMDNHDAATVTLTTDPAEPDILLSPAAALYGVRIEELEVTEKDDLLRNPPAISLTKQIVFVFTLSGGLETEVNTITGRLPGAYASLRLATGEPDAQSVEQSLQTVIRFEAGGQGGRRTAPVNLLGLRDPEEGAVYESSLALTSVLNDGRQETTTIDLTGTLTAIIAENRGLLPPLVYITIRLERTEPPVIDPDAPAPVSGIGGSVQTWGYQDGGTVIVE